MGWVEPTPRSCLAKITFLTGGGHKNTKIDYMDPERTLARQADIDRPWKDVKWDHTYYRFHFDLQQECLHDLQAVSFNVQALT